MNSLVSIIGVFTILSIGGMDIGYSETVPPVTFQLTSYSPVVSSIKTLAFTLKQTWDGKETLVVNTAEWEIRDLDHHRRVARIPVHEYFYKDKGTSDERLPHPEGARDNFDADDLRHIGGIDAGNYSMALLINGVRASNVISFKIDPAVDISKEPIITLGIDEAPPGVEDGSLVAWIVGPSPQDPQFTDIAVAYAGVSVDGVLQKRPFGPFSPHEAIYKTGERRACVYDSSGYLNNADVRRAHAFQINAGKYASAIAILDLKSQTLGRQWDNETNSLAPIPTPKNLLTGVVLNEKGAPAAGWRMLLRQGSSRLYWEQTNAKGEYFFSGIESGEYALWCNPVEDGPNMRMEQVTITPDQTRTINLNFTMSYSVSGRVLDSKGQGIKNVPLQVGWSDPKTQTVCYTAASTQEDGSYEIRGPFPNIMYVDISNEIGERGSPRHHHDAKPDAKDVNFIVSAK